MDPVDALTEIAFLLERDRVIRYKSKAFRTAGDVVVGLSADILNDPVRLKNTKGIGDTTYKVIRQALAGEVPDYLADLRANSSVSAKSELRAAAAPAAPAAPVPAPAMEARVVEPVAA